MAERAEHLPPMSKLQKWLLFSALGLVAIIAFAATSADEKNAPAIQADRDDQQRRGLHCLSKWDGAHNGFRDAIKAQLRDPNSFEHENTKLAPVENGAHYIIMNFRSRNGYGGMMSGFANGRIDNKSCEVLEANLIE